MSFAVGSKDVSCDLIIRFVGRITQELEAVSSCLPDEVGKSDASGTVCYSHLAGIPLHPAAGLYLELRRRMDHATYSVIPSSLRILSSHDTGSKIT
jgi:hypothetical protein